MSLPILCATEGPADLPRVPCAGRCGQLVVRDAFYGPRAEYFCPPCISEEMGRKRAELGAFVGAYHSQTAIEALALFLAPTSGRPS